MVSSDFGLQIKNLLIHPMRVIMMSIWSMYSELHGETLSARCGAGRAKGLLSSFVAVLGGVHHPCELLTASFLYAQDPLVENTRLGAAGRLPATRSPSSLIPGSEIQGCFHCRSLTGSCTLAAPFLVSPGFKDLSHLMEHQADVRIATGWFQCQMFTYI